MPPKTEEGLRHTTLLIYLELAVHYDATPEPKRRNFKEYALTKDTVLFSILRQETAPNARYLKYSELGDKDRHREVGLRGIGRVDALIVR